MLALRREVLHVLGDGGTTDMADRVARWAVDRVVGIRPHDIVGIAEIADMAGRRKQSVCNWMARPYSFPAPVTTLASGRIFDREQVATWLAGHADLVNMEGY
jgi:hypothetical protein